MARSKCKLNNLSPSKIIFVVLLVASVVFLLKYLFPSVKKIIESLDDSGASANKLIDFTNADPNIHATPVVHQSVVVPPPVHPKCVHNGSKIRAMCGSDIKFTYTTWLDGKDAHNKTSIGDCNNNARLGKYGTCN